MTAFCMEGNTCKIYRYLIKYDSFEADPETGEDVPAVFEFYALTEESKDDFLKNHPDAEVTEIDAAAYEWADGREFSNDKEAQMAIDLGEADYGAQILAGQPVSAEQLLAYIDNLQSFIDGLIGGLNEQ